MTNQTMACLPLRAVLEDVRAWGGDRLHHDLLASLERVELIVSTRGIRFLLQDLPAYGKVIDHALSRGSIDLRDLPSTVYPKGSVEKLLFAPLLDRIFDLFGAHSGVNHGGSPIAYIVYNVDPTAIFFMRQICFMFKKLQAPCPPENVEKEVRSFFSIDEGLRLPSLLWESKLPGLFTGSLPQLSSISFVDGLDRGSPESCSGPVRYTQFVADCIISKFPVLDIGDIIPRHGPGAVADIKTGGNKYSFPSWPHSLEDFFPQDMFAYSTEEVARLSEVLSGEEPLGRLLAVPKDFTKPRLITAEPTAHQFLQQGLLEWIRENLPSPLHHCYDPYSQLPSRELARASSVSGDHATVDLSSASDRLSCWMVERIFRRAPSLLQALQATRTKYVLDCTGSGVFYDQPIKKFSGQGSGVTFPVQTITYACCCIAAVMYSDRMPRTFRSIIRAAKRVRVFGDDLIVPKESLMALGVILNHAQLKVNVGKTHYEGRFRESCGMDSYHGYTVTPVYLSALEPVLSGPNSARSLVSWVDVSNNAFQSGLWNLSIWMDNMVDRKTRKLLPISHTKQSCLTRYTNCQGDVVGVTRYHNGFHTTSLLGLQLKRKAVVHAREGYHELLDYFLRSSGKNKKIIHDLDSRPWSAGFMVGNFFSLKKKWVLVR